MVTPRHEVSHRIFQERPELLAPVFRILGVPLPPKATVEVLSPDATEIRPLERRVDSVLRVQPPDGTGGFLLAIEAQGRRDPGKPVSWSYYVSFLKAKYDCPTFLLVVCQDQKTATWASGPFRLGPEGWTALTVHPLVLGPGNVPIITNPERAAENLALASFSALTHSNDPDAPAILDALATALGTACEESLTYFSELLDIGLPDRARDTWRNLMAVRSYFPGRGTLVEEMLLKGEAKGRAEGRAEGQAEGQVKERAESVLRVLEKRGVTVAPAIRERITTCTNLDTLGHWLDRSLTATTADDIFTDTDTHTSD